MPRYRTALDAGSTDVCPMTSAQYCIAFLVRLRNVDDLPSSRGRDGLRVLDTDQRLCAVVAGRAPAAIPEDAPVKVRLGFHGAMFRAGYLMG